MKIPWKTVGVAVSLMVGVNLFAQSNNAASSSPVPAATEITVAPSVSPQSSEKTSLRKTGTPIKDLPPISAADIGSEPSASTSLLGENETPVWFYKTRPTLEEGAFIHFPRTRMDFENAFGVNHRYANFWQDTISDVSYGTNEFIFVFYNGLRDWGDGFQNFVNKTFFGSASSGAPGTESFLGATRFKVDMDNEGVGFRFNIPFGK